MAAIRKILVCLLCAGLLPAAIPARAQAESAPEEGIPLYEGDGSLLLEEKQTRDFSFTLSSDTAGNAYALEITYWAVKDKNVTPQVSMTLKGTSTVFEDTVADLPRIWENDRSGWMDGRFERDSQGNELTPVQVETSAWQTVILPTAGDGGLRLDQGTYTLSLTMVRQSVLVKRIRLKPLESQKAYTAYKTEHDAAGAKDATGQKVRWEAELNYQKSHLEIPLTYDRTTPAVSPNDPSAIRYNLLGGSGYGTEGQWVSWQVDIPEDGYYVLNFVYRQNISNGLDVLRRLSIDGDVPFAECDVVSFPYANGFAVKTLADSQGEPFRLYLSKGRHILKLEVVLTGLKDTLAEFGSVVQELNRLYGKIMVLVGETPDSYRDYDLDKHIDGLVETLTTCQARLNALGEKLDGERSGGSNTARIYEAARTLGDMASKVRDIPQEMDNFRSQINTLADLLGALRNQPLELDYMVLRSPDEATAKTGAGFFEMAAFRFRSFFSSFVRDYNAVGNAQGGKEALSVWVSANDLATAGYATGRDQAQIISRLVTDGFSSRTGIPVNMSLINTADTLLPALVSGKGPDVALFVPKSLLVNLYYRGALVDLTEMPGFEEIEKRFYPSAFISL